MEDLTIQAAILIEKFKIFNGELALRTKNIIKKISIQNY